MTTSFKLTCAGFADPGAVGCFASWGAPPPSTQMGMDSSERETGMDGVFELNGISTMTLGFAKRVIGGRLSGLAVATIRNWPMTGEAEGSTLRTIAPPMGGLVRPVGAL